MEIEVGDFIRTDKGTIHKVVDIIKSCYKERVSFKVDNDELLFSELTDNIVKHSKQLIDLIEVGDYVNGRKVERIGDYEDFKRIDFEPYEDYIYEYDIKTILTHEQFEQNVFRLEE